MVGNLSYVLPDRRPILDIIVMVQDVREVLRAVKVYPKDDTILFSIKTEGAFNIHTLTPAGEHGGPGRVFVRGTPWPVVVLYRNAFTIPKVDSIILAHFRFRHAQCQRIDALTESATVTHWHPSR